MISFSSLQEYSFSLGIEVLGVVDGEDLEEVKPCLEERFLKGYHTPWESTSLQERISPRFFLPGCKSIVVFALPYLVPSQPETPLLDTGPRGKIARCSQGVDYHWLVQKKAHQLVTFLHEKSPAEFSYKILVDNTPLAERALAVKAGSKVGQNLSIISQGFGSWIALGEILTDLDLPLTCKPQEECHQCRQCVDVCPTGALSWGKAFNPLRCISFITQAPGVIPVEHRPAIKNWLYGCDLCQEVCPYNKNAPPSPLEELNHPLFPPEPALIPFLQITKKEFSLTAGMTAAKWRGRNLLLRNAVTALGNFPDNRATTFLAEMLISSPSLKLRCHSAWALGQMDTTLSREALFKARRLEENSTVAQEICWALN